MNKEIISIIRIPVLIVIIGLIAVYLIFSSEKSACKKKCYAAGLSYEYKSSVIHGSETRMSMTTSTSSSCQCID